MSINYPLQPFEKMCLEEIEMGMEWDIVEEVAISGQLQLLSSDESFVEVLCPVKVTDCRAKVYDFQYIVGIRTSTVRFNGHEPWTDDEETEDQTSESSFLPLPIGSIPSDTGSVMDHYHASPEQIERYKAEGLTQEPLWWYPDV